MDVITIQKNNFSLNHKSNFTIISNHKFKITNLFITNETFWYFQLLLNTNMHSFRCWHWFVYFSPFSAFAFTFSRRITKAFRRQHRSYDKKSCSDRGDWLIGDWRGWEEGQGIQIRLKTLDRVLKNPTEHNSEIATIIEQFWIIILIS